MLYKIIGVLGLLGVIGCGASVVTWTTGLGQMHNYVGAVLVAFLCGCAGMCCVKAITGTKG